MANYSLVVGSKYSPFTFEELLKPALLATQAHQDLENQYTDLSVKANVWESLANEQTDPKTYRMYKKYSNDLQNQADALSKHGLTPDSRSALMGLKKRYSQEITPIETAYTRRQKLANEQREARLKDETIMFDNDIATKSLDDFIANPELSYTNYSGKTLASQVGTAAKALSKDMKDNPRKWRSILGDSYYETRMHTGYTAEDIEKAILGAEDAPIELTNLVEGVINSSGIKNWKDPATLAKAYDYARQGLYEGVGEVKYETLDNWRAKMEVDLYNKLVAAQAGKGDLKGVAINPLNIYSSKQLNQAGKNIKDYSKYFTKNDKGKTVLTDEGIEEYKRIITDRVSVAGSGGGTAALMNAETINNIGSYRQRNTPFREFMKSLGADNANASSYSLDPEGIGEVWDKYLKDNDSSTYDAKKVTEFDYPIAGTNQDDMKDLLLTANRGLTLKEVDFDSETNTFKNTGKELKSSDLKGKDYKVVATRFSPYGNTVLIQDKEGNVHRYQMPSGINTTNENNRDKAMQAALHWSNIINTGTYIDSNGVEHKASESEIAYAQQKYQELVQQAYLFHSQLGVQNKTEEQKFSPYGY